MPFLRCLTVIAAVLLGVGACTGADNDGAPSAPAVDPVVVEPAPPIGAVQLDFFGMHDHDPVAASWPAAPIGSYRAWDAGVLWRDVEVAPNTYNFDRLDLIVDTAEENHADVLLVLGQTPPFHAKRPDVESFYGPGAASPPDADAWRAYVTAVVTRYRDRDVDYQVWNEANVNGFWAGTPSEMAALTAEASAIVRATAPHARLVAPAMAQRLISQRAWFEEYYEQQVDGRPVGDYVDVVALHLYPEAGDGPDESFHLLQSAYVRLDELGLASKPVWDTEINYGVSGDAVDALPVEEQQAQVAQTLIRSAAEGVRRVYWYGWDQQSTVNTMLSELDGSASPAGRTYAAVADWLVGSVVEGCHPDASGTHACSLRRSGSLQHVFWSAEAGTVPAPPGALEYETADGRRASIGPDATIPVGPLPVLVEVPS